MDFDDGAVATELANLAIARDYATDRHSQNSRAKG